MQLFWEVAKFGSKNHANAMRECCQDKKLREEMKNKCTGRQYIGTVHKS